MEFRQNFYNLQSFTTKDLDNKRIGILGGSFNPPHQGHVAISKRALELGMDYVLWLVAKQNPYKEKYIYNMDERIQKSCDITKEIPNIMVSNLEIEIGAKYSFETITYLSSNMPKIDFTWLMGVDCLEKFHLWEYYDQFPKLLDLMIFNRDGAERLLDETIAGKMLQNQYNDRILFIKEKLSNLSSTNIRKNESKNIKEHRN